MQYIQMTFCILSYIEIKQLNNSKIDYLCNVYLYNNILQVKITYFLYRLFTQEHFRYTKSTITLYEKLCNILFAVIVIEKCTDVLSWETACRYVGRSVTYIKIIRIPCGIKYYHNDRIYLNKIS